MEQYEEREQPDRDAHRNERCGRNRRDTELVEHEGGAPHRDEREEQRPVAERAVLLQNAPRLQ
jgi:hypothetical protein